MKKKLLSLVLAVVMCMGIFAACAGGGDTTATLSSISIVDGSFNSTYYVGDTLDLTNAKISVKMSDDTTSETAITAAMVTGFDSSEVTESKKLIVTHKVGEITKTAEFSYKILAVKTLEEKFLETVDKNMLRQQYSVEVYDIESKQVNYIINTQRDASGNIAYSCAESPTDDRVIYEIFDNNKYYDYSNKKYYNRSAEDYSKSNELSDALYQLKSFPIDMLTKTETGYKFGEYVEVLVDQAGLITEILVHAENFAFRFKSEFKRTEPDKTGFTFVQDYDMTVHCGCDIHSDGKFVDNVTTLDYYYIYECKKAGKEVEYIYIDEDKTILLDIFTKLTDDMNLYVAWRDKTASVEWRHVDENDNESTFSYTTVTIGQTVEPYLVRNYDTYVAAWFTDKACINQFDFTTPITQDIELYGKLVPDNRPEYRVDFSFPLTEGSAITGYNALTREGEYIEPFDISEQIPGMIAEGWYRDNTYTTPFDPKTPITQNLQLYIKLIPDNRTFYTVTVVCGVDGHTHQYQIERFKTLNGSEFTSDCDKYETERDYSLFANADLTGREYSNNMPITHDCTLYVKWGR